MAKLTGFIVCDKAGRPARSFGHFAINVERKDAASCALAMQKACPNHAFLYEYTAPATVEVGKPIKAKENDHE